MTSDIIEISTIALTMNKDLNLLPPLSTLGDRIRAVRSRAGLSQANFAEMVCCSRQTLIRWERDDVSPLMVLKSTRGRTDLRYG